MRALAPEGIDAALDLAGTETALAALELGVAPERIATIAAGPTPPGGVTPIMSGAVPGEALDPIAAALAAGDFVLPIAARFPLERIDEAIALQRGGHVRGKVVVDLG